MTVQRHRSPGRGPHPQNQAAQRGLSGPVGTYKSHDLSRLKRKIDIYENRGFPDIQFDILHTQPPHPEIRFF